MKDKTHHVAMRVNPYDTLTFIYAANTVVFFEKKYKHVRNVTREKKVTSETIYIYTIYRMQTN